MTAEPAKPHRKDRRWKATLNTVAITYGDRLHITEADDSLRQSAKGGAGKSAKVAVPSDRLSSREAGPGPDCDSVASALCAHSALHLLWGECVGERGRRFRPNAHTGDEQLQVAAP
jgi:hypothetical protein